MKRRDFFAGATTLAVGSSVLLPERVQAQVPKSGTEYVTLGRKAPVDAPTGKIEVLEFFWYSCPHCSAFEPALGQWVKKLPKDVVFKRVPVAFQASFVPQQQLFYALEAMGLLDKLHTKMFAAIHLERQKLDAAEAITAWALKQGVDKDAFANHFNSFTTAAKARRATQLMTAYELEGVPAIGVAGKFYTDGALAGGSMDRALQVADYLIAEVRAGR